jgi:hypothetical protein
VPHKPCRADEKGDNEQGVNKWIGNSCVRWQLVRGPPPGTVLGDRHFGTIQCLGTGNLWCGLFTMPGHTLADNMAGRTRMGGHSTTKRRKTRRKGQAKTCGIGAGHGAQVPLKSSDADIGLRAEDYAPERTVRVRLHLGGPNTPPDLRHTMRL